MIEYGNGSGHEPVSIIWKSRYLGLVDISWVKHFRVGVRSLVTLEGILDNQGSASQCILLLWIQPIATIMRRWLYQSVEVCERGEMVLLYTRLHHYHLDYQQNPSERIRLPYHTKKKETKKQFISNIIPNLQLPALFIFPFFFPPWRSLTHDEGLRIFGFSSGEKTRMKRRVNRLLFFFREFKY